LNLDYHFAKKFGKLKKACVLFFYGRINDAFDVIASAAERVQQEKEILKEQQTLVENRWIFKLGLPPNFQLPEGVEKMDPEKIDKKYLKSLGMSEVSLQTLKVFIEHVSPYNNE